MTADSRTVGAATNLYIAELDAPAANWFQGEARNVNDTKRRRANYRTWIEYGGQAITKQYNWYERQSLRWTAAGPVRDNTYDDAGPTDNDETDDNNVHWDAVISLGVGLAAPGALHHFKVIAPATGQVGDALSVKVIAEDAAGNPITNFTGAVNFTHNGTAADATHGVWINGTFATGDDVHTFVASDGGVFTLSVKDYTAETFKITASGSGKTGDSNNIVIA